MCNHCPRFIETESNRNLILKFWWQYIEMVSILLSFTRAQREANWYLHLALLQNDHTILLPL